MLKALWSTTVVVTTAACTGQRHSIIASPFVGAAVEISPLVLEGQIRTSEPGWRGIQAFVQLYREKPDSLLVGTLTGPDGVFHWTAIPEGTFVMVIRALGHERLSIPVRSGPHGLARLVATIRPLSTHIADVCTGSCIATARAAIRGEVKCREAGRLLPSGLGVEARLGEVWRASYEGLIARVDSLGRFNFPGEVPFATWIIAIPGPKGDRAVERLQHVGPGPSLVTLSMPC